MERNAYFDNAKLLLIFLVVFGHVIQPITIDSTGVNTLYKWIYTFHMPAFIFLAGFFAKGSGDKNYLLKLAKKLLLPYVIFQFIYSSYYIYIGDSVRLTDLFHPHWSLWFLFSLFSWHILLYWFKRIPAVYSISITVLIGLIVGYFPEIGHQFSLSRTFVFFPFFLLGYLVTTDHVMRLKQKSFRITSIIVMTIVALAIYYAPEFNSGWLLASKSYGDLGMPEYGGAARLLVYITATLMAMSVLAWVPNKQYKFTKLGTRTLYVYLLHGIFIQYFRQNDVFYVDGVIDLFGLAVISAGIVLLLSSRPILSISQPIIEGKASILKKYVASK
ncbi:Fucose 4-O-acetylase [Oceanobacillus limi]|uniref:Fucose 4-O-acetylase n=1 Tax=Oceanobacillus limi TaxID=930131 RepID=A0A1I0GWB5_9BACI|nr:acyltransferase family protein [Oceanobacillus limi]SET75662.1 Fucose 4-O-acetylase [Oceanobacillus limi]